MAIAQEKTIEIFENPQQAVHILRMGQGNLSSGFFIGSEKTVPPDILGKYSLFRSNFYEINFYRDTEDCSAQIGGRRYTSNGHPIIFFIAPLELQSFNFEAAVEDARFFSILISRDVMSSLRINHLDLPFFKRGSQHAFDVTGPFEEVLIGHLQEMQDVYQDWNSTNEEILKSLLEILLLKSKQNLPVTSISTLTPQEQIIGSFMDYLGDDTLADKTASHYAQVLNISEKHLNTLSKKQFGKTTLKLIHEALLSKAKALLLQSRLTVAEVAYELGYEEHAHFSRFFKHKTGLTPISYRTMVQNW